VVSTILLVLSESATLTNALTRGLFLEEAILETFDGVSTFSTRFIVAKQ